MFACQDNLWLLLRRFQKFAFSVKTMSLHYNDIIITTSFSNISTLVTVFKIKLLKTQRKVCSFGENDKKTYSYIVHSLRFEAVEVYLWAVCHASRFTIKLANYYAPNWFNCLILCPFWAKSGKYYPKNRGKLMQLCKERTVIALGLYLIRGKLQLLQTSVNIL